MADAFGEVARALAADVDEAGIAGDLVQGGQSALGFWQQLAVQLDLEL
jgi:hypothetical protein